MAESPGRNWNLAHKSNVLNFDGKIEKTESTRLAKRKFLQSFRLKKKKKKSPRNFKNQAKVISVNKGLYTRLLSKSNRVHSCFADRKRNSFSNTNNLFFSFAFPLVFKVLPSRNNFVTCYFVWLFAFFLLFSSFLTFFFGHQSFKNEKE